MKGQKLFLPVTSFSKVTPDKFAVYDDRYIPAEIVVMHNGLNRNLSYFSDEAIAKASWSLTDIPILGFIKELDGNQFDFDEHNISCSMVDDEFTIEHLGKIIGNIPKENEYHYTVFPDREETFVIVRGYLWSEYMNKAFEIFKKNKEKSVSMEIVVDDGYFDDNDIFCITEYRYLGICILGDDVEPAMTGAKITVEPHLLDTYSINNKEEEVNNLKDNLENVEVVEEVVENFELENETAEPTDSIEANEIFTDDENIEEIKEEKETEEVNEMPFAEIEEKETSSEILTDELKAELEELRLFKQSVLDAERENKLNELFSVCISNGLDIEEIKSNADGKSFDEIKQEVAMLNFSNILNKKETQTLPESDAKAVVKDNNDTEDSPYGKYTKRIKK